MKHPRNTSPTPGDGDLLSGSTMHLSKAASDAVDKKHPELAGKSWLSIEQMDALTRIAVAGLRRGDSGEDIEAAFLQWLEVNVPAELAARGLDAREFAKLLALGALLCWQAHKVGRID